MLSDFGVEVTVIEYADRIIPTEDQDISKEMQQLLTEKRNNSLLQVQKYFQKHSKQQTIK